MASGVELATAYVSLSVEGSGISRDVKRAFGGIDTDAARAGKSAGKKMGGGMGSGILGAVKSFAAPIAAALGVATVAHFLKDTISAASDLNEAGTKTQAIFGASGAKVIEDYAKKASKSIGQSRLAATDAAATFGTFGKAAGKTGKPLAEFSTGLVSLSSDLASFFNTSPEDAAQAISAGLRGEAEPLRRYGVLLDDASLRQEALRQGLIKTTKNALTPQQKVLAAQSLIYKQTADAQGDFAKTSGGLANSQRSLSASFEDLKAKIGEKLLPVATRLTNWVKDRALPAFEGLYDLIVKGDFTSAFREAFGVEEDSGLVAFLFRVRDGAIAFYDGAKRLSGWLSEKLWPALKNGYETIMPGIREALDIVTGGIGDSSFSWQEFGDIITEYVIPFLAKLFSVYLPYVATQIRVVIEVVKAVIKVFLFWRDKMAEVTAFILNKFADITETGASMFRALSKVPGFGWAKDAADKLQGASDKARGLATAIGQIPNSKNVDINVRYNGGKFVLGNGVTVDPGVYKARAAGGPVRPGESYVVGEHGPELLHMGRQGGAVTPNHALGSSSDSTLAALASLVGRIEAAVFNGSRAGIEGRDLRQLQSLVGGSTQAGVT